ncbi:LacI family transcriptional regulator [Marinobacterium aestuarii]|uniref:LacI family transcriptional regulator n=1 Tax=Marinobacterium aestuarii TaxID=1821621 RepID=A0A1A9F0M9_9GAMM|nr:LacI family DNA-binding transcriptional regulator [Marinobacterium aestuarii]ANG63550.1 LacI family transcriptional regulator [Marinobacterium aestuarii]
MKPAFALKQIAAQAGVSLATVDRVINQRPGVRLQTTQRVQQALQELEQQAGLLGFRGRSFYIDVIIQAPERFTSAVQQAIHRALPLLQPLRIRPRFHLHEDLDVQPLVSMIQGCARRGSQGLILKGPDEPAVNQAVQQLTEADIPVVTLVSDLPHSGRCAYIGMDDRAAGRTAAHLMQQWLQDQHSTIAVNVSNQRFRGEEEREMGFRQLLREQAPNMRIADIVGGLGIHGTTYARTRQCLQQDASISAVYSAGGANRAIIDAFAAEQRDIRLFIGHDLDRDNRALLLERRIDAIIDHDLAQDAHRAFVYLLQQHGVVPVGSRETHSRINIVTAYNL